MFGNRLGWGISGVLAALMLLIVWQIGKLNAISAPSQGLVARTGKVALNLSTNPQLLDPIQLPFNPTAVLPTMTEAGNAAPAYRNAINQYLDDPKKYDNVIDPKTKRPTTSNLQD